LEKQVEETVKLPSPTSRSKLFTVRSGTVPGIQHTRKRVNNQDSYVLREIDINGAQYTIGVVSDGCTGNKKRSRTEIGSGLLTLYVFSEVRTLLALNVPLKDIPAQLYARCVSFVGNIARATIAGTPGEMASFIENMFLCTLVGFVKSETEVVTFQAGDGFVLINDQDLIVDQNDRPTYLAYHQIDHSILGKVAEELPDGFETNVYDVAYLERLAVGTDGLVQRNNETKQLFIDPEERDAIFSYQQTAPAGLQWWLNKQQNRHSRFDDDTTIITLLR
jgi:hypothetical protein